MNKKQSRNRKLNDAQRAQLLQWLAEGLTTQEINTVAASFDNPDTGLAEPFTVSPQLCYQYRHDHELDLTELRSARDEEAIVTGLAIRANRLKTLFKLARELEADLYERKRLWTQNAKTVANEGYKFEEFNEAEIRQLRGVLDDIAKETNGRIQRVDLTTQGKKIKGYVGISPDDWDADEKEEGDGKD